jgi:hypothetical protein
MASGERALTILPRLRLTTPGRNYKLRAGRGSRAKAVQKFFFSGNDLPSRVYDFDTSTAVAIGMGPALSLSVPDEFPPTSRGSVQEPPGEPSPKAAEHRGPVPDDNRPQPFPQGRGRGGEIPPLPNLSDHTSNTRPSILPPTSAFPQGGGSLFLPEHYPSASCLPLAISVAMGDYL